MFVHAARCAGLGMCTTLRASIMWPSGPVSALRIPRFHIVLFRDHVGIYIYIYIQKTSHYRPLFLTCLFYY